MLHTMELRPALTEEEQSLLGLSTALVATWICQSAAHFRLNAPLADVVVIHSWFTH